MRPEPRHPHRLLIAHGQHITRLISKRAMEVEDGHIGCDGVVFSAFSMEHKCNRRTIRRGQPEKGFVFALRTFATAYPGCAEQHKRIRAAAVPK